MLYDPKWDKGVKADPLSLNSLIAWLKKQPASKEYPHSTPDFCLLGQWARSMDKATIGGFAVANRSSYDYRIHGETHDLSCYAPVVQARPHTFGAALQRAKKIKARNG